MKFIHAGLNLLAFALVVVSMVAVFDFHNTAKIPNMYSLHSWLGLAAVILYCLQVDRLIRWSKRRIVLSHIVLPHCES